LDLKESSSQNLLPGSSVSHHQGLDSTSHDKSSKKRKNHMDKNKRDERERQNI
jgi:hypothetical protein